MVFSNSAPKRASLSADRWSVYAPSATCLKSTSGRDEGRAIINRIQARKNSLPEHIKREHEQRQLDVSNGDIDERYILDH